MLTTALYYLLLPFVVIFKAACGGSRASLFLQRFGFYESFILKPKKGFRVWVHASSVGETGAACSIIDEILKLKPDASVILSTVTSTGLAAAERLADENTIKIMAPLDFTPVIERSLNFFRPDVLVLTETELWPNLIMGASKQNIRVITANGRISESSCSVYKRLTPLSNEVLSRIAAFSMISEKDGERILDMGAKPESVFVSGNSKYDQALRLRKSPSESNKSESLSILFDKADKPVIVAGSTRPGEERIILSAFEKIRSDFDPILIIAPRHLERCCEIKKILDEKNIKYVARTEINKKRPYECSVILLDTMGELASAYRLANLVICGGSLLPFGGQNPLEAAAMGKPLIFGPHMDDFACESTILKECGSAAEAKDMDGLASEICKILEDRTIAKKMGSMAYSAILKNSGAARRNAEVIIKHGTRSSLRRNSATETHRLKDWNSLAVQATFYPKKHK